MESVREMSKRLSWGMSSLQGKSVAFMFTIFLPTLNTLETNSLTFIDWVRARLDNVLCRRDSLNPLSAVQSARSVLPG